MSSGFIPRELAQLADRCIALPGLLLGGTFAVMGLILGVDAVVLPGPHSLLAGLVGLLMLLVSGWQVVATILNIGRPSIPVALATALLQPRWPKLLRPIIALWWAQQFVLGTVISIAIVEGQAIANVPMLLFCVLLSGAFTYAAYGFLLLTVTCFTKSPPLIAKLWSWRVGWSMVHAGLVLAVQVLIQVFE